MKLNQYLSIGIVISILLHIILALGLMLASYGFRYDTPPPRPREWVEFKDDEHKPLQSDETRRVKKETRRRETSPTTLMAPVPPTPITTPNRITLGEDKSLGKKLRELSPSDNDVFTHATNRMENLRQQLQTFLPRDLEIGDVDAMNTDKNLFFSFYNRMAEKVIYPWAMSVVDSFEKMKATGRLGGQRKAWLTVIEVILDKKGNVVSTSPLQLAGDWDIDNAPIKAFKQAKMFPNPPPEMVEEDGYIRIRYKFLVYYNPM